jgi:hypothetical protein
MKDSVSGVVRLGGSQASAFDVEITEKLLDLGAAYHLRNTRSVTPCTRSASRLTTAASMASE